MSTRHHALAAPDPRSFAASTVALTGTSPDPLAMAMTAADGFVLLGPRGSVAGAGVAARLRLPCGLHPDTSGDVARWLAAVPATGSASQPGSGPLAVGALPFLPGQPTELLVPLISVVSTAAGRSLVTVVRPAATSADEAEDLALLSDLAALLIGTGLATLLDRTALATLLDRTDPTTLLDGTAPTTLLDGTDPTTLLDSTDPATLLDGTDPARTPDRRGLAARLSGPAVAARPVSTDLAAQLDGAGLPAETGGTVTAPPPHRTRVGAVSAAPPATPVSPDPERQATTTAVEAIWQAPDGPEFERRVTAALAAIASGRVGKVVLARQVHARFTHPLDPVAVLRRLQADEPTCAVFAHRQAGGVFLGASPELLVRRRGDRVVSHPLAGTSAADDAAVVALVASTKEQAEHRTVAEAVADRLAAWCDVLQVPKAPTPVRLHGVAHLGTRITGRLHQPAADALTLAAALHPTPAVAGVPTGAALALITDLEDEGRGFYAGPVGWVDARGDGELLVAIRSATVAGNRAVAYGGAGIVAGSAPDRELAETAAKLHTALGALGIDAPAPSPV